MKDDDHAVYETDVSISSASTSDVHQRLLDASSIERFLTHHKDDLINQSLTEHLAMLLKQKNVKKSVVVEKSNLDRTYVYQIFQGIRTPSRDKLICIAFGLGLTVDETQRMLKLSSNRELYVKDERDAVIIWAMHSGMDIVEANELLYDHHLDTLGVAEQIG